MSEPLINQGLMQLMGSPYVNPQGSSGGGNATYSQISASTYTLTAADSGLNYQLTNTSGVTITGPATGVTLTAAVVFDCPATGTVTVTPASGTVFYIAGGGTSTASQTFTRAQFPTGFVLTPHAEANAYSLTAAAVSSGPALLAKWNIPVIYSGALTTAAGSTGAVTGLNSLATALATRQPFWLYLPAANVGPTAVAGSVAGLYYAVYTGTTTATVSNIYLSPGSTPYIPTSAAITAAGNLPTLASTYAAAGALVNFFYINIPGNSIGSTGQLVFDTTLINGAGAINPIYGISGGNPVGIGQNNTATTGPMQFQVNNLGATNLNAVGTLVNGGFTAAPLFTTANVDSTAIQALGMRTFAGTAGISGVYTGRITAYA